MSELKKLSLPGADGQLVEIQSTQSLLFIGANGSGKTRLGAWLDSQSTQKKISI